MVFKNNMKIRRNINNVILIIIIFSFCANTNSKLNSLNEKLFDIENIHDTKVKRIDTNISLDKEKESCDIDVSEKVLFSYDNLTTSINHLIISKRFSIFSIKARLLENSMLNGNKIVNVKLYSNANVRKLFYNTITNNILNDNNLKENWVVSIELKNPVKEIEIEFLYSIQNAILINIQDKRNVFQYDYINPYSFSISDYKINIEIRNFKDLNTLNIESPDQGKIESIDNNKGLKISLFKDLPELSQYSISLPLPYEIEMCYKTFANIMNIILYSTIFLLTSLGLITCFKLYKE